MTLNLEKVVVEKNIKGKRLPMRNRTVKGALPWNSRITHGDVPGTFAIHFPADRVEAIASERQAKLSSSHLINGQEIGTLGIIQLAIGDPIRLLLKGNTGKTQNVDVELLSHPVKAINLIPKQVFHNLGIAQPL